MGLTKKTIKSPSERLRAVFYQHFKKEGHEDIGFDEYYQSKMEMLIEHYKKLLIN